MLRFFRKIRQRLLTENPPDQPSRAGKFTKYLLYVIVEVFIVIIGILIAFQVDNYNITQQEQKAYYSYLLRLKEDMQTLRTTIGMRKEIESRLIELGQYEMDVLTGKIPNPNPMKLALAIEYTGNISRYEMTSPTYMELIETGNLSLIEDDSLMTYLSGYQTYIQMRKDQKTEWEPWIKEYRSLVRNILDPEDRSYIDLSFNLDAMNLKSPVWKDFNLQTPDQEIVRKLLEIKDLKGLLQDILSGRKITVTYQNIEVETSTIMIRLIQAEIDRLDGKP